MNRVQGIALAACLSLTHPLFSGVLDHLKPMGTKTKVESIRGVDYAYMINLDERPEKYEASLRELAPYGIVPFRVSACNGWTELTLSDIADLGVKYQRGMDHGFLATRYLLKKPQQGKEHILEDLEKLGETYFVGCLTRGGMGCVLSHLSILKDAYDSGYETIWVMEDDIEVLRNPHIISDMIDELDKTVGKKWGVLYTDYDHRDRLGNYVPAFGYARRPNYKPKNRARITADRKISKNLRQVGARFGTHSMIIRRHAIRKLLTFFKKYQMYFPIDFEMNAPEGMYLYTVLDDIVSNKCGWISDLGRPTYNE